MSESIELHELKNLLAVIHGDGGHHTEEVGLAQSVKDAHTRLSEDKGKLDNAKMVLGAIKRKLEDERMYDEEFAAWAYEVFDCDHPQTPEAEFLGEITRRVLS